MRKTLIALTASAFVLAGAITVWAQSSDDEHSSASVDKILGEIRAEQHLGPHERINPDKVSDKLMEELGDAVMDQMVPSQAQHEYMDRMMGGEGSASLDSMHRWIAYRFLTGGYGRGGYGYGMMGPGFMGGGMMGYGHGAWGMMGNPDVPYGSSPYESPEQIAKQRYARGEITREQYLQLMKDLKQSESGQNN